MSDQVDKDTRWRCRRLTYASLLVGTAVALVLGFTHDWVFQILGGEFVTSPEGVIVAQGEGLSANQAAFWAYKLLYEGPIPYAIIGAIVMGIVYGMAAMSTRLVPFAVSRATKADLDKLAKIQKLDPDGLPKTGVVAKISPKGQLMERLRELHVLCGPRPQRSLVQEENDRLTAYEEATISFCLRPLEYVTWLLPILGFIGTVWGVTEAVEGLRFGISALFRARELNEEVLANFMLGFKGLVLAFDTTLFGLIGLGLVGSISYLLTKTSMFALISVSKGVNQLAARIPDEDEVLKLVRQFFATDKQGNLLSDKERRPVLRWQQWMDQMLASLAETDKDGQLKPGKDGKPVLRWQQWMDQMLASLVETDKNGQLKPGKDGKPVLRWQQWMDLLLSEFFFTDSHGNVVVHQDGHPASKSAQFRAKMMRMLVQEIYEVTDNEAERIATGYLEEDEENEVPLRSRPERRHNQVFSMLNVMAYLVERSAKRVEQMAGDVNNVAQGGVLEMADATGPGQVAGRLRWSGGRSGSDKPEWRLVCPASGDSTDLLAVSNSGFVFARQPAQGAGESMLVPGQITLTPGGGENYVAAEAGFLASDEVGDIGLHRRLYACLGNATRSIEVHDASQPGLPAPVAVLEEGNPEFVALMPYDQMLRAFTVVNEDEIYGLYAFPADGSTYGMPLEEPLAELAGPPSVFRVFGESILVCAAEAQEGVSEVTVLHATGTPRQFRISAKITSLALVPGKEEVWFGTEDGRIGSVDLSGRLIHQPARVDGLASVDFLAATAAGHLYAGEYAGNRLMKVNGSPDDSLTCAGSLTVVAVSPNGRHLMAGCEDGTVLYCDCKS